MIRRGEKRRLREELACPGGMQDDAVAVDRVAHQAQATALDLENRIGAVALTKQDVVDGELAKPRTVAKRLGKPVAGGRIQSRGKSRARGTCGSCGPATHSRFGLRIAH